MGRVARDGSGAGGGEPFPPPRAGRVMGRAVTGGVIPGKYPASLREGWDGLSLSSHSIANS